MKAIILTGLLAATSGSIFASTKPLQWSIKHQSWTEQHEQEFSDFIFKIGKAKANKVCHTTEQCLRSPVANPKYAALNPADLGSTYSVKKEIDGKTTSVKQFGIYSDCADLPFILRAYFAWINDLPFTFPVSVSPRSENDEYRKVLQEKVKTLEAQYEYEKNLVGTGTFEPWVYDQDLYTLRNQRERSLKQYDLMNKKYSDLQFELQVAQIEYQNKGGIFKKAKVENISQKLKKKGRDLEQIVLHLKGLDFEIKRVSDLAKKAAGGSSVQPDYLVNLKKEIDELKNGPLSIRYTRFGNKVNSNASVKNGDNINSVMVKIRDAISTAHFRVRTDTWEGNAFPVFYSPAITNKNIKPGTVLYDTDGHVAMVYEVTKAGEIFAIDAHPDNSLTRIAFNAEFNRSPLYNSGGFLNWRPVSFESGVAKAMSNKELASQGKLGFEQYLGNHIIASTTADDFPDYKKAVFIDENTKQKVNFYEFVESRLRDNDFKINPLQKFEEQVEFICSSFKSRATAVDEAIGAGISKQLHPNKLPANIYGTEGDWEVFATPSSDLRRRIALLEFSEKTKKMVQAIKLNDPSYDYEGDNIVADLLKVYDSEASSCKVEVKKSNGQKVALSLSSLISNVYKLSFDPYHCAELRWGIYTDADYEACQQGGGNKVEWYFAQQKLRNSLDRDLETLTNLGIAELEQSAVVGTEKQEQLNIRKVLESL